MFLTKMNGKIQVLRVLRLASVCNCLITLYHHATSQFHLACHLVCCFYPQTYSSVKRQFKRPKAIQVFRGNSGVQGQFRCSTKYTLFHPLLILARAEEHAIRTHTLAHAVRSCYPVTASRSSCHLIAFIQLIVAQHGHLPKASGVDGRLLRAYINGE